MKKFLTVVAFMAFCFAANATHLISAELTYEHKGDSNYLVRVEYMVWCGGTIWAGGNPPIGSYFSLPVGCVGQSNAGYFALPLTSVKEVPIFSYTGQSYNSCGSSGSSGYTGYKIATYDSIVNIGSMVSGCDVARLRFLSGARISTVNV